MSDYTKLTAYDTKDALSTGDPLKRIKGTELDDEFDAISVAIATKANSASPSFSGTPTAPTASYGVNTTQLATTAFVQAAFSAAKEALYPVGTIYTNISVSTNPATLLGFGTWVAIAGRVVVGLDASDASFDTAGETGGSKDISFTSQGTALTEAQMPKHYHAMLGPNSIDTVPNGSATNVGMSYSGGTDDDPVSRYNTYSVGGNASSGGTTEGTANGDTHTHAITASNATLQPYVVAYVWKRTA
jgi:hypothetical protein